MNMLIVFLLLSLLSVSTCTPGLQKAAELIMAPLNSHRSTKDIVLPGVTNKLESAAYKLQVLRRD